MLEGLSFAFTDAVLCGFDLPENTRILYGKCVSPEVYVELKILEEAVEKENPSFYDKEDTEAVKLKKLAIMKRWQEARMTTDSDA